MNRRPYGGAPLALRADHVQLEGMNRFRLKGVWIAVGMAIGTGIGVAMDTIIGGIGIGIALGIAMGLADSRRG